MTPIVVDAHPCSHAVYLAIRYPGLLIAIDRLSPDTREQPRQPIAPQAHHQLRPLEGAHRPPQIVRRSLVARCRAWLRSLPWGRSRLVYPAHEEIVRR